MKGILLLFLSLLTILNNSVAQTPPDYPAAPLPAGNITKVEYFIRPFGGTDPGFGNAAALATVPQQDINGYAESINLGALPQGYYRITVRSVDADGKWSLTNTGPTFDYIITPVYSVAPTAPQNIVRLEYAIDANIPVGSGVPITVTPATDITGLNAVIDLTGIPQGPHVLYIRSLDAAGKWSLTNLRFFDNSALPPYPVAPVPAGNIEQLEYFIDTDPGFGQATAIPFTPGTNITVANFSIPTTGLTNGIHQLYIRSRNNPWGVTTVQSFLYGTALPVTWLYVQGQLQTNGAQIKWATASESNTDKFEIEYSTNGIDFAAVGIKAAAGNSSSTQRYEFLHSSPLIGKNYYRIKQMDLDGRFSYSAIIVLQKSALQTNIVIAPNPVQDRATIYFGNSKVKTIQLTTTNGAVLLTETTNGANSSYQLDMRRYIPGVYLLRVQTETGMETHKIIKQ